jgi:hypothetical protein
MGNTLTCVSAYRINWNSFLSAIFMVSSFLLSSPGYAQSFSLKQPQERHYLMAADDGDDSYDPFSDYSEFDEASDEEADIHFFKNGRFFTIGLVGGIRGFTGNLATLYGSSPTYGIFLSYFFDLNLALQFGFVTGDHNFNVSFPCDGGTCTNTGNVSLTMMNFHIKYYFNTQNVTRGLADLNPYMIGGVSQNHRTYTVSGVDGFSRDSVMGVDAGLGIEIPMMRRKAYFGIQSTFHYANFKDANTTLTGVDKNFKQYDTGVKPSGQNYDFLGILGLNF